MYYCSNVTFDILMWFDLLLLVSEGLGHCYDLCVIYLYADVLRLSYE